MDTNAKILNSILPNHIQNVRKDAGSRPSGATPRIQGSVLLSAASVTHSNRPKEENHRQTAPNLQRLASTYKFSALRGCKRVCIQQKRSLGLLMVFFPGASDMQCSPVA